MGLDLFLPIFETVKGTSPFTLYIVVVFRIEVKQIKNQRVLLRFLGGILFLIFLEFFVRPRIGELITFFECLHSFVV